MASVRQHPDCSTWYARFVDHAGKKKEKSTGTRDRREAQKIADAYEAVARRKFTVAHVQRTLRDLMADATGAPAPGSTIRDFFKRWLEHRKVENAPATYRYHESASRFFLEWAASNLPRGFATEMSAVTSVHLDGYRAFRLDEVSVTTVNQDMKCLRQIFDQAKREGIIIETPLVGLKRIGHYVPAVEIRAFTMDEVKLLLAAAGGDNEWRSMILFGLYTGQRLGDIARLDWRQIDLQRGELAFTMAKTRRKMLVPLAVPLLAHLFDTPTLERLGPVHPRLAALIALRGKSAPLSAEFHRLLVAAKILPPRPHERSNDLGRRHRRCEVSFHSFRHTATSMLRDAGAPVGVAMELIGHCSPSVHRHYAHLGADTLRRAVSLLPPL